VAKIIDYLKNAPVIIEVIRLQAIISRGGGQQAIKLLRASGLENKNLPDRNTLDRCANFGLRIGASFGLLNSCLTRSAIRCLLLRRKGIDARVAFGVGKKGERLDGHCWLVEGGPPHPASNVEECGFSDFLIFPDGVTRIFHQ